MAGTVNVLSLFDGMSCGQIALNRCGIKYDNYFASEIDKHAIKVTQHNYPATIQLGSVMDVHADQLPKIDLLIGGSPCQGFSFAGKRLNFEDPRSKLFFEYVRLLKECKPKFFLLENVCMAKDHEDIITGILRIKPMRLNSSWVSAQFRKRLYWTNIAVNSLPKKRVLVLSDIIDRSETKFATEKGQNYSLNAVYKKDRPNKLTARVGALQAQRIENIIIDGRVRQLSALEYERLQTVPDNYTRVDGVSDTNRRYMLGNGWTIDIICHIFNHMKQ